MVIDLVFIALSFVWAFYLRFDFSFPPNYLYLFRFWLPIIIIIQLIVFNITGFYQIIWRFTSLWEILTIVKNVTYSFLVGLFFIGLFSKFSYHPGSVLLNFYSFNIIFICISRVSVRLYFSHIQNQSHLKQFHPPKKLLLIGAGKAGAKVANEINNASQSQYEIIGFIDDDIEKQGGLLNGKKIFCGLNDLVNLNVFYDELLITAPNATGDQMRRIVKICKETGKRYKTIPSLNELIDGESHIDAIRDVSYSDLLGRDEVKLDMNSIEDLINGKRVLITGAGGSIGSELVEQCINFQPSEIICLDINEEKIYNLDQKTEYIKSNTIFKTVLASINNYKEIAKVFIDNRPQIVFHAAAYKHVPIQELHPWNAVKTNLGGTMNLVDLSDKYGIDKFVLVSTDKAVNPVNVMGATKRAAEKLIQSFNQESNTTFMAVRFGNVLGSSGSAIPTFQKQINNGGPITNTHPDMSR